MESDAAAAPLAQAAPGGRPEGATALAIAVLVPCLNEERTVAKVVRDFAAALPGAAIHVYDNNSTDGTGRAAREAGATVRRARLAGKGNVVRRMFADVEADAYVLVDGDDTYDAASASAMVARLVAENLDMVVGARAGGGAKAYRSGHRFGNRAFSRFIAWLFGPGLADVLSGYRVFSRRFVKSFPALAQGFEIETELTVHALELRMPVAEMDTPYGARPDGSESKLRTWRDGWRILWSIAKLFQRERPLAFFGGLSAALALAALALAAPLFVTYAETGLVPRFPTAILASGMMLLAALSAACGFILHTVTLGRQEIKRLVYLGIRSVRP